MDTQRRRRTLHRTVHVRWLRTMDSVWPFHERCPHVGRILSSSQKNMSSPRVLPLSVGVE